MTTTPKIFKHFGKIIFQFPSEPGKPFKVDTYFITRGAITWPTAKSPAYYCIFGLKDEPTLTEKNPLVLLVEGEETSLIEKFFERLTLNSTRLFCERLFADLREENEGYKKSLYEFVRERKVEDIRLSDSSRFENIEYGISLIKQWHHDNALKIGEDTILRKQLKEMGPDDLKDKLEE
ncbi:MAG: hypothetical protein IMF11_16090, partial [Proteobacteria bacterium]|nr:hypothetical protein [Pseudomonadota bacterium]